MWDQTLNDRRFVPGTRFEDVVDLYYFDAMLRDFISDALEAVEISLRSSMAFHFGKSFGAFGHLDPANFDKSFSRQVPENGIYGCLKFPLFRLISESAVV